MALVLVAASAATAGAAGFAGASADSVFSFGKRGSAFVDSWEVEAAAVDERRLTPWPTTVSRPCTHLLVSSAPSEPLLPSVRGGFTRRWSGRALKFALKVSTAIAMVDTPFTSEIAESTRMP